MKSVWSKTALWVVLTVLSAAIMLARGAGGQTQGGTPSGNAAGAALFKNSCGNCHAAEVIDNHRDKSAEEYREIVNTMIDAGARITPQEIPVLVDYLVATYGKKPAVGAPQAAAVDPGKALLESACATCHGLETMVNHVYDTRAQYESLIASMVAYGAMVSDAQMPVLAEYMLKTYGKKPAGAPATPAAAAAATPDPGKQILERACTSCHGLDGMANHVYANKADYEGLVKSMVAYGAVVPDAQLPVLVDYMFKTYGKK